MAHHSNGGSGSGFSFSQITRHEEFHINGGDLFFLVEHVQFRVHRYFFERESVVFRKQLMTPASPGASRQGTSESSAIILEDVRSSDFAKFLWVFYNPKYSLYHTSTDDWTIILDLAHRWEFPEVQNLVVRELEKLELPDVTRVSVYHKYGVDRNLLLPRYAALCEREEPLSLREGMMLGMETTLNIARAREYARANRTASGARSPGVAGLEHDEMRNIVREMFDVKPLEGTGDQDERTSTPSGGLAQTRPLPRQRTEPSKEKMGKPPAEAAKPPMGKPEMLQLNLPPTGAQQKKQKAQKKSKTGSLEASTPTETTPTTDPIRQHEVPAAALPAQDAGTVAEDKPLGTSGEVGGKGTRHEAGDKVGNGKPEQESGSVENTTTTPESSVNINASGVVNTDTKAGVTGGVDNLSTTIVDPSVNTAVSGDATGPSEAKLLDL